MDQLRMQIEKLSGVVVEMSSALGKLNTLVRANDKLPQFSRMNFYLLLLFAFAFVAFGWWAWREISMMQKIIDYNTNRIDGVLHVETPPEKRLPKQ